MGYGGDKPEPGIKFPAKSTGALTNAQPPVTLLEALPSLCFKCKKIVKIMQAYPSYEGI